MAEKMLLHFQMLHNFIIFLNIFMNSICQSTHSCSIFYETIQIIMKYVFIDVGNYNIFYIVSSHFNIYISLMSYIKAFKCIVTYDSMSCYYCVLFNDVIYFQIRQNFNIFHSKCWLLWSISTYIILYNIPIFEKIDHSKRLPHVLN